VETSQLPGHWAILQNEFQKLKGLSGKEQALQQEHQRCLKAYEEAALALRQSRQQQAQPLAEAITAIIQQLGMPKGFISVEITPTDKMQVHGMDKVEYKVCTNPGMIPDSLAKIASGGELSRISLAIHRITAQRNTTPTLFFDEVDVGIGGSTAALVGQLLRRLSDHLQLFCITHQPQVASCAHQHFRVEKYTEGEQTFSRVTLLGTDEKVEEIARMLGGLTITEQTRSHAREMLENS
jgi:DNA repair protein RecN (Recombination protein N)